MSNKLNVLLAKTDHLASSFKNLLSDYVKFFKTNQGSFRGEKKTYEPRQGMIDVPGERNNKLVVTTVTEKLKYLEENSKEYIDALFSQEKTNSSGLSKAKLVVDNVEFGEFSSLELLRLKSLLETGSLKEMYETLPVRNDDETWTKTQNDMYTDREIYESALRGGVTKSITKEQYILPDPNINANNEARYTPQIASKDTVIEVADYTHQRFTGETSHVERANVLGRRTRLLTAVIAALKEANDVEAVASDMTSQKIFSFLHKGTI